jgi:hypothetical protein
MLPRCIRPFAAPPRCGAELFLEVIMFDRVLPVERIWDRWGFILNRPTFQ